MQQRYRRLHPKTSISTRHNVDSNMTAPTTRNAPTSQQWPQLELDYLSACPICNSTDHTLTYKDLRDVTFGVAAGSWNLWTCDSCSSGFLNPRPSTTSIKSAYGRYYTHEPSHHTQAEPPTPRLRNAAANGFLNWRFGTNLKPASMLGIPVALTCPPIRRKLEQRFRQLPKIPKTGKVLDLGCGNGNFVAKLTSAGITAEGVDFDPNAVQQAKSAGLNVNLGDITYYEGETTKFDIVTMNHVIEHIHNPTHCLEAIYRILKKPGFVHMEYPNINSLGHETFGQDWRGLEVPRHITLPSIRGIQHVLEQIGFQNVRFNACPDTATNMFRASDRLKKQRLIHSPHAENDTPPPRRTRKRATTASDEFISVIAEK